MSKKCYDLWTFHNEFHFRPFVRSYRENSFRNFALLISSSYLTMATIFYEK